MLGFFKRNELWLHSQFSNDTEWHSCTLSWLVTHVNTKLGHSFQGHAPAEKSSHHQKESLVGEEINMRIP